MPSFYSGTSGLVLPVMQALYPPAFQGKSRLTYYASLFNSVEINSSFYKMPMASTVRKWGGSVPEGFRFTFKLSKAVSHAKGLRFNGEDVHRFMQTINAIEGKRGCLLVQLPPSLKVDAISRLEDLLETINDAGEESRWKIAVEFRHPSWYHLEVYRLLRQYGVAVVVHDMPNSATPLMEGKENFVYLRFHGPEGGYRGSYADDDLKQYAEWIKTVLNRGKEVYVYFNNTIGGALTNLQTLNRLIQR